MSQPQPNAKDDLEPRVISNINDFGWHAVNVIEDDSHPPWTYSIGFYETWGFPELIIIGRSRATAHYILNTVADGLDEGRHPDLNLSTPNLIPGVECSLSATTLTTSDLPDRSSASDISRCIKSFGPITTVMTPGTREPQKPLKSGSPC